MRRRGGEFLERHGQFETIMLENPTLEGYRDALRQLRDRLATRRSDRDRLIRRVALEPMQKNALPNTLALFFFAGIGGYERGSNFLLTRDTKVGGLADVANAPRTMMPVTQIQSSLREAAAASVLILDTNFTDIEEEGDPPPLLVNHAANQQPSRPHADRRLHTSRQMSRSLTL